MSETMKKPRIRFKGFTEAWEQRKAIELAEYSKGNGYSKNDLTEVGTPIILYGRLYTKYQFSINEIDTFAQPRSGAVYSQGNEVIVPASGETAEDIARASAVEKSGVLLGGDLNVLRPFGFIAPEFLALALSNGEPQKELAKKAQGKSVVHIHNSDIQEVSIAYPSRAEQDRIVSVFRRLDNLITLHQRKYDKLLNIKKSMLEKMFPKNGNDVPEIRFKGFTDAWEQRKFGDYNDLMTGYPFESDKFSEDGIKLVRGMNVKRGYLDFSEDICVKWNSCVGLENFLLKDGDILIQMDGALIGKSYAKIKENQLPALLVQRVTRARTNNKFASQDFMYQTIQRDFLRYIEMNKTETAVPHLSLNDIRNFEIMFPCLAEQKKIGDYFESLDHLITLHQCKLEKLKNIKKSMLEKMFV